MHKNTIAKKFMITVAGTALLSLLLVACGTDAQSSTAAASTTTTPTTTAAPVSTTTSMAPATAITSGETTTTSPARSTTQLLSIRMVDSLNGWALTNERILRTADGGHTWHDITPSDAALNGLTAGNFLNKQTAWIATPDENASVVTILRTTNGGQNWNSSQIHVPYPASLEMPHFIGSQGWIEIITNGGPGAGSESADIWHSNDSGATWQKIASTDTASSGLTREGFKSGISFRDALNGWATTSSDTGRPQNPGLYVTHDGGKTWQSQKLGYPQGQAAPQQMGTTPPVFFGNTGVLPVHITLPSLQQELVLYMTYDGGKSWTPTTPANVDFDNVYVIDPQHAWASATQTGDLFVTSDGGKSWQHIKSSFGAIKAFSFSDPATGWAISSAGLLQKNKGNTWHQLNYTID